MARIETREDVCAFLDKARFALKNGAQITFQRDKKVDCERSPRNTNKYTVADLFPDETPTEALKRELLSLTEKEYIQTVKDARFPKRGEMREFGKSYVGKGDVFIRFRVELLDPSAAFRHTAFVLSFHYSTIPFAKEHFPYK